MRRLALLLFALALAACGGRNAPVAPVPPTSEPADVISPQPEPQPPQPEPQLSLFVDGFVGHESEVAFGVVAGLDAVRAACAAYDLCNGQLTVLPPNMRVVQLAPSTTETIDGHPCFDPRPYGMPESEYQKRLQERGYGCAWGYASIQDWSIYLTPHVLADGSLDPEHVQNLANHETKHLVGAWNHGQVLCPDRIGKIWLNFGHGGECDLTGGP